MENIKEKGAKKKKNIRIKGKAKEILPKLLDIIAIQETRFSKSNIERGLSVIDAIIILFFFIGAPIADYADHIIGSLEKRVFRILLTVLLGLFMFVIFVLAFFLRSRMKYPKKFLTSLKPVVNYDTLKAIFRVLTRNFPDEEMIITIYTDYKTKEIVNTFLKESKTFKLFGKEFLKIPNKKIETKISLKKWEISLPERNLSLVLKQNTNCFRANQIGEETRRCQSLPEKRLNSPAE